jgi:nitroreductase
MRENVGVTPSLDDLAGLIMSRRTNLRIDADRPVDLALVERLCGIAVWAPNHKRTHPWRFAALVGDARRTLGELVADHLSHDPDADHPDKQAKIAKTRSKYLRSPVVLMVASESSPGAIGVRRAEDRDAAAAGVQNLLLAAHAAGLATYWGTGALVSVPEVHELCGFSPDAAIVAAIYLGWPTADVPNPGREAADVRVVGESDARGSKP